MAGYLRTNTATIVTVGPFYDKGDGVTIETGLTITNERITLVADDNAGGAPTLILDNVTGAASGTDNDLNYIINNDAGLMGLELSAANLNRLGRIFLTITDAANHVPVFHEFIVLPANVFDSLILGTDLLQIDAAQLLGTAYATPTVAGVQEVDVTHWLGTAAATPTVAGVPEVDNTHWRGTAIPAEDTAGYPKVTIKDGSGAGEINLTGGAVDQVASVTSIVAVGTGGITAASIAAGAIGASEIATDAANKIADHVLRRKQANVEASADGDAIADAGSQYGLVQQAQKSNTVDNAGFLTVYETDGVTEVERIPLDTDAAADPIVGAG